MYGATHPFGRHEPGEQLSRHRHVQPYAAVVLEGGYVETGDCGRFSVEAGHVILHGPYESHQDAFTARGALVLNLPLPCDRGGLAAIADPDPIVRLAERDPIAACDALIEGLSLKAVHFTDWPDELASQLIRNPEVNLGAWARSIGLAPQSLSRGFRQVYGVTPKRFRAEQRALAAVRSLKRWSGAGAGLAAELGFADQAHMIKAVRMITGAPPRAFR